MSEIFTPKPGGGIIKAKSSENIRQKAAYAPGTTEYQQFYKDSYHKLLSLSYISLV